MREDLDLIAEAQIEALRRSEREDRPNLLGLLQQARSPRELRHALLREEPLLRAAARVEAAEGGPGALRREALGAGALDALPEDLDWRELHPGLDLGIRLDSHAMGLPSVVAEAALREHALQWRTLGVRAFQEAGWMDLLPGFARTIEALVGAPQGEGGVAHYANFSEALSAALYGLSGPLVTDEGHFTAAHYVHDAWSARTGSPVTRVPLLDDGTLPPELLIDALTPETAIVSISSAFYRTGYLHDLEAIAEAMMDICPDAALLLDVYQTLGTVPLDVGTLPWRTAILGGGGKQLRAGLGAGFAWYSADLLPQIRADRTGWWGHRAPLDFDHGPFVAAAGADALRTGTPPLWPIVAFLAETRALAASGEGDLRDGVERARAITWENVANALELCEELGLTVMGGADADARAAFLAIDREDGAADVARLAAQGIFADFRADAPGEKRGVVRLSTNNAGFAYELRYALRALAAG